MTLERDGGGNKARTSPFYDQYKTANLLMMHLGTNRKNLNLLWIWPVFTAFHAMNKNSSLSTMSSICGKVTEEETLRQTPQDQWNEFIADGFVPTSSDGH